MDNEVQSIGIATILLIILVLALIAPAHGNDVLARHVAAAANAMA